MKRSEARNTIAFYLQWHQDRSFWDAIKKAADEIASWPPWKRGISTLDTPPKQGKK